MLEELHAVIRVDDDERIVGEPAVREMGEHLSHFVVEFRHAAVVEIDDLVEVEFLARRALPADDLEGVGQPRHREFRFARIGGIGVAGVPGPLRSEGRMRRGVEHVEQERLAAGSQPRYQATRTAAERLRQRHAAEIVELGQQEPPQPVVREQRHVQPQILGALPDQVLEVPLVVGQIDVVEAERILAHVRAAPVRDDRGTVARFLQMRRQGVDAQPRVVVAGEIVADAVGVRPGAGEERDQAGRGACARDIAVCEQRSCLAEPVDVRRQRAPVAECAQPVGAQRVRADHQDVGRHVRRPGLIGAQRTRRRLPGRPGERADDAQRGRPQRDQGAGSIGLRQRDAGEDEQGRHAAHAQPLQRADPGGSHELPQPVQAAGAVMHGSDQQTGVVAQRADELKAEAAEHAQQRRDERQPA